VRITLKKAYSDGTVAVDMDPLSLLCRLATSVPPPRFHTVKYAGVLPRRALGGRVSRRNRPKPPTWATSRIGRLTRAPTARGLNFWRARSRSTFSFAPPARAG